MATMHPAAAEHLRKRWMRPDACRADAYSEEKAWFANPALLAGAIRDQFSASGRLSIANYTFFGGNDKS
jgi:hypothetical protein